MVFLSIFLLSRISPPLWAFFVDTSNGQITARDSPQLVDGQKMAFPSINLASYGKFVQDVLFKRRSIRGPQPVFRDAALTTPHRVCVPTGSSCVEQHLDTVHRPIPDVADNLKLHQAGHACI